MRLIPIWTFVQVPKLTAGRRRLALQRMRAAVESLPDLAALLPVIDSAIAVQERMISLRAARPHSLEASRKHAVQATALDAKLDRAVSSLHGVLTHIVRGLDDGAHDATLAAMLLQRLFPGGVAPITQLPYVDQYAVVDQLAELIRTEPELADAVAALGLETLVERIETLNEEYGKHVTRTDLISTRDLRDADRAGWLALCTVVAELVGAVSGTTDEDDALRGTLLLPIVRQHEELKDLRASRRSGAGPDELADDATDDDELGLEEDSLDDAALDDASDDPETDASEPTAEDAAA